MLLPERALQDFSLQPAAVLSGRVVNAAGQGVVGRLWFDIGAGQHLTATSDANGEYSVTELPAATSIEVTIQATGFAVLRQTLAPLAQGQNSQNFTVSAGVSVGGRVLIAGTQTPIAGAVISLTRQASLPVPLVFDVVVPPQTATTDQFGNFLLNNVADGNYVLIASAEGYVSLTTTVQVQSSNVQLSLSLVPDARVSGVVIDGLSRLPVTEGNVYIRASNAQTPIPASSFVPLDQDGTFSIRQLAAGNYTIWYLSSTFPAYWSQAQQITVTPSSQLNGLVLEAFSHFIIVPGPGPQITRGELEQIGATVDGLLVAAGSKIAYWNSIHSDLQHLVDRFNERWDRIPFEPLPSLPGRPFGCEEDFVNPNVLRLYDEMVQQWNRTINNRNQSGLDGLMAGLSQAISDFGRFRDQLQTLITSNLGRLQNADNQLGVMTS